MTARCVPSDPSDPGGRPRSGARPAEECRDHRAVAYLAARWPVGLFGGGVLFPLAYGGLKTTEVMAGCLSGERPDGLVPTWPIVLHLSAAAAVLLFLDLAGLAAVAALERRIGLWFLGPGDRDSPGTSTLPCSMTLGCLMPWPPSANGPPPR